MINHPDEFAATLRDALVVHAMLERTRRDERRTTAVRLAPGRSLSDLFPAERRRRARHVPPGTEAFGGTSTDSEATDSEPAGS
jgi:hypothetical protein